MFASAAAEKAQYLLTVFCLLGVVLLSYSGSQGLPFLISQFDFNEYYRSKTNPSMDTDE